MYLKLELLKSLEDVPLVEYKITNIYDENETFFVFPKNTGAYLASD